MSVGFGIFLMIVGAILAFGVQDNLSGVDLTLIGYIVLAGGALVTVLSVAFLARKRKTSTTVQSAVNPATGEKVEQSESSIS